MPKDNPFSDNPFGTAQDDPFAVGPLQTADQTDWPGMLPP